MEFRTASSQVTFHRAFQLKGVEGLQPPGSYTLTVEEEKLDTLSVDAWHRTSATLHIPLGGAIEHAAIDMDDLRAALARDASLPTEAAQPIAPSNPPRREVLHFPANRT